MCRPWGWARRPCPNMLRTLRMAGISEQDFFKTCNASFKLGVLFANWNVDQNGKQIDYVNPFAHPQVIAGVDLADYYLQYGAGKRDFIQCFSTLCRFGRGI